MKTAFITGASRGIGRALAERFLSGGNRVIGTSRSGAAPFNHPNLLLLPLELSNTASRAACIKKIDANIDIFINNAGMWHAKDNKEVIDPDTLRETLEVNLIGPVDVAERIVPLMNDGGHIINISSRRGSMEFTTECLYPCYAISKAGLNMFTRLLAARLKGRVTVSCVHPGFVKTDMNEGDGERTTEEVAEELYRFINSGVETGHFWYKGERYPW